MVWWQTATAVNSSLCLSDGLKLISTYDLDVGNKENRNLCVNFVDKPFQWRRRLCKTNTGAEIHLATVFCSHSFHLILSRWPLVLYQIWFFKHFPINKECTNDDEYAWVFVVLWQTILCVRDCDSIKWSGQMTTTRENQSWFYGTSNDKKGNVW